MKKPADQSYKSMHLFKFHIKLPTNRYVNLSQIHLCFPIRFRKSTKVTNYIDPNVIPINIFFIS